MAIYLTARDYRILDFLSKEGFAFFEQLQGIGFQSQDAAMKRLSLLRKAGFIQSQKVKVSPALKCWFHEVWGMTSEQITHGLHRKTIYLPGSSNPANLRVSTDSLEQMVKHQLGLNRVIEQVSRNFSNPILLTEADVHQEDKIAYSGNLKLFPDLVFVQDRIRLAVEYERSLKAKKRYFDKMYRYKSSSRYSHLIYVCETRKIFDTLSKMNRSFPQIGFLHISDFTKVFTGMGWMNTATFLGIKKAKEEKN